ncbi:hypothetical protein QTO34_019318 [Cnephaeus nilssonii]|uniref:Uncharacterized protein n=1 Tax=Cnephaeus nilssonii TaxID=3371016 RepID=A0AA40HWP8_CNENI|nr:hypothetical protein QTO34_019318 [Eptesicus nilssonii]
MVIYRGPIAAMHAAHDHFFSSYSSSGLPSESGVLTLLVLTMQGFSTWAFLCVGLSKQSRKEPKCADSGSVRQTKEPALL